MVRTRRTDYFKALKSGMGVEDRQDADDVKNASPPSPPAGCYSAWRGNGRMLQPPKSRTKMKSRRLAERGMVKSRALPGNLDVRTFVVDVARLAGSCFSRRQPLPGTIEIWQGASRLTFHQTLRNNRMLKDSEG